MSTGICWHPFFFITHLENSLHVVYGMNKDKRLFSKGIIIYVKFSDKKNLLLNFRIALSLKNILAYIII